MNRFIRYILIVFVFITTFSSVRANSVDDLIKKSKLNDTATISVSIKDTKNGHVVYQYNQNKFVNPASVQKIFTMKSAYDALGKDFTFNTTAYIDKNANLYLKLSGDPSFTTEKLTTLLKDVKSKYSQQIHDVIVDATVIDTKQWGVGWMWDDDISSLLPKYSPFAINQNNISITISPNNNGVTTQIKNNSSYPMQFVNYAQKGKVDNIEFERMPWLASDMTYVRGTVSTPVTLKLPVASPEKYFMSELKSALKNAAINYNGSIKVAPLPLGVTQIATIESDNISDLLGYTLKNSNNFYSEMIFKVAAAKYFNKQGTTLDAVKMFKQNFEKIKNKNYVIVDACGISRNNMITADFVTEALNSISSDSDFVALLAKPMEGTLANRLLNISLKVRAKTGTASAISSIAGYVDSQSGKKYSFAIFVQNHNLAPIDVKRFEDELINAIYKM